MNVLAKILIPRITASIRYILSELEEMEREEIFRLKRVKQNKMKSASHVEVGGGEKTQISDEPPPKKEKPQVAKKSEGETDTAPPKSAAKGDPTVEMKLPQSGQTEDDLLLLEHIETMKNVDELIKTLKEDKDDDFEQSDEEMSELAEVASDTEQLRDVDGLESSSKEGLEGPVEEKFKVSEEIPDTGLLELLKIPSVLPLPPKPDDKISDMEKEDEPAEMVNKTSESSLNLDRLDTANPKTPLDTAYEVAEEATIPETSLYQPQDTSDESQIPKTPPDQAHELAEDTTIPEKPLDQNLIIPDTGEKQEENLGESIDKENIRESSKESVHKDELSAEIPEQDTLETTTPPEFSTNVEIGENKSDAVIKSSVTSEKDIIETTPAPDTIKSKPSVRIKLPTDSEHSADRVMSKTSIENTSVVEAEISLDRSAEDTVTGERGPTRIDRTDNEGSVQGISDVDPYFNAETVPVEVFEDIDLGTEYTRSEPTREADKDSEDQKPTSVVKEHVESSEASASKPPNEVILPKDQLADNRSSLTDRSTEDSSDRKDDNYEADVELDETDVDVGTSREPQSKDAKIDKKENKQDPDADKKS